MQLNNESVLSLSKKLIIINYISDFEMVYDMINEKINANKNNDE